jgi:hypothetical protein
MTSAALIRGTRTACLVSLDKHPSEESLRDVCPDRFRAKRRVSVSLLASGILVGLGILFLLGITRPRNRVSISIRNIPGGVNCLFLVSESNGKFYKLPWSLWKFFYGSAEPVGCSLSDCDPVRPQEIHQPLDDDPRSGLHVLWVYGDRYGVVTRTTDENWHVTWFDATDVPLKERRWLSGGGRADFDLAKGKTELLTPNGVKQLGLERQKAVPLPPARPRPLVYPPARTARTVQQAS